LLVGFCFFLFFFGLAHFGLLGADEPRYAQVAREMLAQHDWITPTLGGKPWLEKPPLYYWQAMLCYRLFGVSDWAARLPSAVDATFLVLAIYIFLKRFRPGSQLDGALMTASAAGVLGFARAASTDMPLAMTFTVALLSWYAWAESGSKTCLATGYVFLALGVLAKGPVAPLLAAVVILSFAALKRDWQLAKRTLWLPGILVFGVAVAPWFLAVQLRNPEFFRVFILQHNLERFSTNLYHHRQPFWFYLPVALLALLPWCIFVVAALAATMRGWWRERGETFGSDRALEIFLTLWLIVPIAFFSISQSKLPGYILPALPAATILLANYVRRRQETGDVPSVRLITLHALVAAASIVPALMIQYLVLQHRLPWNRATLISLGVAAVLAIATALTLRARTGLGMLRFVTLIPVVLTVAAVLRLGAPTLDAKLSARSLADEISRVGTQRLPMAVFRTSRETEFGLAFYRDQVIARYERDIVPMSEHLVVAPHGSETELVKQASGRRVVFLGSYAPQGLDYYWVAGSEMRHVH